MNLPDLWQATLAILQLSVTPANFKTWFTNTSLVKLEKGVAEVGCPNPFTKTWLEERYAKQVANALAEAAGEKVEVSFTVIAPTKKAVQEDMAAPLFDAQEELTSKTLRKIAQAKLNPRYTMDHLVVGSNNQLAVAVAQAIIAAPGQVYNPFFLWGGVGVGKTHLMQAIGHALLTKDPDKNIVYSTSEDFTNEMIEAIQNRKNSSFRSKYREVDLLLIDDIQFISGREGTQEEFFNTFNALHGSGKQLIMTSDRPPKDIAKLEERRRSRFEWGMIVDIQQPNKDMRVAILSFKCRELGMELPFEVANLIAEAVSSVRELEGTLMRVITTSQLTNQEITLELAQQVLGVSVNRPTRKAINHKEVLNAVAEVYEVKISDLKGARRYKEIVVPRFHVIGKLREDLRLPLTQIAEILGGRDHTTIMHGVEKYHQLKAADTRFKEKDHLIDEILYH